MIERRFGLALVLALALMLVGVQAAEARPGATVYSYGYFGTVDITEALPSPGAERKALAVAVGPANETVVVSSKTVPCAGSVVCWDLYATRYDANGALDAGFGSRAGSPMRVEYLSAPGSQRVPQAAVAISKDGRTTIAAGTGGGVIVARLSADGSLDPSFGTGGRASTALGGAATVTGLALVPEGGALVTGGVERSGSRGLLLVKYTAAGLVNVSFRAGGQTPSDIGGGTLPAAVAVGENRIYLGTPVCCSGEAARLQVGVFAPNGSEARRLSLSLPKSLGLGRPRGISAVIPTGNASIYVVGGAAKGSFVAHLLAGGKPDKSFGEGGYAAVRGLFVEGPSAAVADKKGRVVLSGWRRDPPDTEGVRAHVVRVFRLLADGRPDPKFGGVRPLLTVASGTRKVGLDILRELGIGLRTDGRILILGEATADPREGIPVGPYFGLALFLGK